MKVIAATILFALVLVCVQGKSVSVRQADNSTAPAADSSAAPAADNSAAPAADNSTAPASGNSSGVGDMMKNATDMASQIANGTQSAIQDGIKQGQAVAAQIANATQSGIQKGMQAGANAIGTAVDMGGKVAAIPSKMVEAGAGAAAKAITGGASAISGVFKGFGGFFG